MLGQRQQAFAFVLFAFVKCQQALFRQRFACAGNGLLGQAPFFAYVFLSAAAFGGQGIENGKGIVVGVLLFNLLVKRAVYVADAHAELVELIHKLVSILTNWVRIIVMFRTNCK